MTSHAAVLAGIDIVIRDRVRDRVRNHLASARHLAGDLAAHLCVASTVDLASTRDLDRARANAWLLVQDLDAARTGVGAFGRARARNLNLYIDRASNYVDSLTRTLVSGSDNSCADVNVDAFHLAREITFLLDGAFSLIEGLEVSARGLETSTLATPHPMARRLIEQIARRMPAGHRVRYREELRAELGEIAATSRWWGQLAYGLRVASRVVRLRWVLRGVPAEPIPGSEPR